MAIHREKYTSYDGPRDAGAPWWVVAWSSLKWMVGFTRTKFIVPALWLPSLIAVGAALLDFARRSGADVSAPGGEALVGLVATYQLSCMFLFLTVGPGIVSHDLQHNSIQLYFSKPVSAWDYGFGKWLALFMLAAVVTIVPCILVMGTRLAFLSQHGLAQGYVVPATIGLGLTILTTAMTAAIGVGVSSVTGRTGFVVLIWIAVIAVPGVAASVLELAMEEQNLARVATFSGAQGALSRNLLGVGENVPPVWMAILSLGAYTGLGVGLATWRIRRIEGAS